MKYDQRLFDLLPETPTWNEQLLIPSPVPISDYYSLHEMTPNLLHTKQREDPILFAILSYQKDNNPYLIRTLPRLWLRFIKTGRFSINADHLLQFY